MILKIKTIGGWKFFSGIVDIEISKRQMSQKELDEKWELDYQYYFVDSDSVCICDCNLDSNNKGYEEKTKNHFLRIAFNGEGYLMNDEGKTIEKLFI